MNSISAPALFLYVEAYPEIGFGHLFRCLSIAEAVRSRGEFDIVFISASDAVVEAATGREFSVRRLPGGAFSPSTIIGQLESETDPLLLDTYAVSETHLSEFRSRGCHVAILEDGRRLGSYDCRLVIDSAPNASEFGYSGSADTEFLLGCSYYPLRSEFRCARDTTSSTGVENPTVVVTFGGADPHDLSGRFVDSLEQVATDISVQVVLGPGYQGSLQEIAPPSGITLHRDPQELETIFAGATLAISAAGSTAMDFAYLGVPMILFALSKDQTPIARSLADVGAAVYLPRPDEVTGDQLAATVNELARDPDRRERMASAGRQMIDGGGAERIADALAHLWTGSAQGAPA